MTDEASREDLGSAASLLEALADAPGLAPAGPLEPGRLVGDKYRIVRAIGQGGMGVVYLARDVRLARDVAIKLGTQVSAAALERAEREAQTLAKLSHPNVVVVYEVGEHEGRWFVAMEHVRGGTARIWCTAARTPAQIIALYAAAGDGLAAAHAAGIVHRDFKPDNVLVGDDGRPRVADFGLALVSGSDDDTRRASAGTPAYMAPEQRSSGEVDARADQYAFCASLWEALFGSRPPRRELRNRGVPAHVIAALERGLADDPAARWPALTALLAELRRDPRARLRRIGVAVLVAVTIGSVAVAALSGRAGGPCGGGDARIAEVWNAKRAAAIAGVLSPALATGVRARLDAIARHWVAAEREACRATRVDATQSEALLERRIVRLERVRTHIDVAVTALTVPGTATVEHALDQVSAIPSVAGCDDVAQLGAQAAVPADPGRRTLIDVVTRELAGLRRQTILNEPVDRAVADRAVTRATGAGWPPLVAEALYVRALVALQHGPGDVARASLERAATTALAGAADDTAAWAMADLAWSHASAGAYADASQWADLAEALWQRLGRDPDLGVRILGVRAIVQVHGPRPADALATYQRQVALAREAFDDPINEAVNHLTLALGYHAAERLDDARREVKIGLDATQRALGPDHPKLRSYLVAAAQWDIEAGELEVGEQKARRALALTERWHGPDSIEVAGALETLLNVLERKGDLKGARETAQRARAIVERVAPRSQLAGTLAMNLGVIAARLGENAEALREADRALAALEPLWGKDNPQLITLYVLRGYVARAQGELAGSEQAFRKAIALADKAGISGDGVNARVELSYTLVKQRRARDAVALLEPALAHTALPPTVAELHLALADALWQAGERARARTEATTARAAWTALGEPFHEQRDAADAWLRTHR